MRGMPSRSVASVLEAAAREGLSGTMSLISMRRRCMRG